MDQMETRGVIWFHAGSLITRSAPEAHKGSRHRETAMGSGASRHRRGGVLRTIKKAPAKDCRDLSYVRRRSYDYTRIIIIMFVLRVSILACRTYFSSAEALTRSWRLWRHACVLTYRDTIVSHLYSHI